MELVRTDVRQKPVRVRNIAYSHLVSEAMPRKRLPIDLLHGAGGDKWYWEQWVNLLTREGGYATTAPDILGHGGLSHIDIRATSIRDFIHHQASYISDVLMPKHGGLKPVVVGHSMGGLIAQKLCEMGLVYKVILIAPAPPKGIKLRFGRDFKVPFRDYYAITESFVTGKPFRPSMKLLRSAFADPEHKNNKAMIERCSRAMLYESRVAVWELLNSSIEVDASKVTVPMLVIGLEKDHIITPGVVEQVADKYPQAELVLLPRLGHLCPLEHGWRKVAKLCLDWIA